MFLWLLELVPVHAPPGWSAGLAVWSETAPRAALAGLASLALALLLGPRLIGWLRARFREPIKSASPVLDALHAAKQATPTMGGLFILAGVMVAVVALGDLTNPYVAVALLVAGGLTVVGVVDDLVKLKRPRRGLGVAAKFTGQLVVALIAALWLAHVRHVQNIPNELTIPLLGVDWQLGWWAIPLSVATIVGASNAVNLTDGLDGLAGGCLVFAMAAVGAIAYAAGHAQWAVYLGVPHVSGAGEMVVLVGAVLGAVLGFLWFNCHPAQVFMGDTGSLPLGGMLGLVAVVARQELLLVIMAGVFVVEALSVIAQVAYFKCTRRRLLRCAPLHHHFQFLGWPEGKIVVRFWIAAALCALLGVASLKVTASISMAPAAGERHQVHAAR